MNRPLNLFWSESSHYFGANSPIRNFERNVPEESSREELVLERTVPEPSVEADQSAPLIRICIVLLVKGYKCMLDNFACFFFSLGLYCCMLIFSKIPFQEYQNRPIDLSCLIWVQTVCKIFSFARFLADSTGRERVKLIGTSLAKIVA